MSESEPAPATTSSASTSPVTACVLIIGNEILSGRTQDANLVFLGKRLNELGIRLLEARVVPDSEDAIIATVNEVRVRYDYVFTTGGIGPTHDDITAECIAKAFCVPLIEHPEARALLEAHYEPGELNEARLRMARTPKGATLIPNPVSRAPGFQIGNVYVMAGIPVVVRGMVDGIKHRLTGGSPLLSHSISVALPEGAVAQELGNLQRRYPEIEIGSYPFHRQGRFGTTLVLRAVDPIRLDVAVGELRGLLASLNGEVLDERGE